MRAPRTPAHRLALAAPALATLTLAAALHAPALHAQDAPAAATRRDLLDRASAARAAGRHAEALAAAQQALALQSTPSVRLFIATEQIALSRFAEGFANARVCVGEATRDASLRNRDSILAECNRLASESADHVGFVRVHMPPDADARLTVRVNGAALPRSLWAGAPYPVEAGSVRVELVRRGSVTHTDRADVVARETVSVHVSPESVRLRANEEDDARGPGAAPWALFGIGLGVAAAGGVLYGVAFAIGVDAECAEGVPPTHPQSCERGEVLAAEAGPRAIAVSGLAVVAAGGVAAAAGLVWALVAPRAPSERLAIEPTGDGLRVRF